MVIRFRTSDALNWFPMVGKIARAVQWQWLVFWHVVRMSPACINCHNVWLLPLCALLKLWCRSVLIYDTHELETETHLSRGLRRVACKAIERMLIHTADLTFVVCESIGDWYRNAYGLQDRVMVVRNFPTRATDIPQKSTVLRELLEIDRKELIFLYQGVLGRGRGVELLLEAFTSMPDRHVVFLGFGKLVPLIQQFAALHSNIHYLPAVAPAELSRYTAGADVGLSIIENLSLSYYYCLPNKLFEYLNCGVPVVASDFPEMAAIIRKSKCGWLVPVSVDHLIRTMQSISPESIRLRSCSTEEFRMHHCWEREERVLTHAYRLLFKNQADLSTKAVVREGIAA
jgi:glycosyltransferase involved in cell wall biosynthesis